MNKRKFSGIITLIASILMIGSVKVWAPVCQKSLELANGGECHMKCFYYGQIMMYVGILLLAEAIVLILLKHTKAAGIIVIVTGILMLLITNGNIGIGVCPNPDMMCNSTAFWGRICSILAIAGGILAIPGEGTTTPQAK